MDNFFQTLRDIQNKERSTGILAEVDDSFYTDASNYLQDLLKVVDDNPLSLEAYQLRDAQRITTEICERREFKIISTAVANVQKSHDIFKGHKDNSDLYEVIPYNTTPEEEEFYRKMVDMIVNHRENLMDKIVPSNKSKETKIGFRPKRDNEELDSQSNDDKPSEITESDNNISENPQDINQPQEVPSQNQNIEENKPRKSSKPVLDESQIALMFGQAPDDTIFDENNNPVKAIKHDVTTPFKPPEAPVDDTVSLQNDTSSNDKHESSEDMQETNDISAVDGAKISIKDSENNIEEESSDKEVIDEVILNKKQLVSFNVDINTDILDEDKKSYGPFNVNDIVLLPQSVVKILYSRNVVNLILD